MQKRKEDIMNTAERLFNEKGYNAVSLRDISDAIGISKGNLTYYFQKKEDLVEACALRSHKNYQKPTIPHNLEELNNLFSLCLLQKRKRPYFFKNYIQLSAICPKVYEIQNSVTEELENSIIAAIENLVMSGEIRSDCVDAYSGIVHCMMSVLVYGIPTIGDEAVSIELSNLWNVLVPCFTEKGLRNFRKIQKINNVTSSNSFGK